VESEPGAADQRHEPRQGPFLIAFLGAVAVGLLLLLPISVPDPDDSAGPSVSCGDALSIGKDWQDPGSGRASVHAACTDRRVTRLAEAAGAVSLTLVVATFLVALPPARRRREKQPATA
jgi:hypothetical protein